MRFLLIGMMVFATTAYAGGGHGGQGQAINSTISVKPDNRVNSQSTSSAGASSSASGGSASISEGAIRAGSQAHTGDSSATGGSANISVRTGDQQTASSAAPVYASYCQTGGSGQVDGGGFSIVNGDQFCEHIRMADRALLAWQQMETWCNEGKSSCDPAQADAYLAMYHENLADADALVQSTHHSGWLGRVSGQLGIPIAILALLLI